MFVFGSGVLIGTPQGGTPINFGLAQEVTLNVATTTKALYGQYNFPVAIGSGTRKMTGKAKLARISGQALGYLFFGVTPSRRRDPDPVRRGGGRARRPRPTPTRRPSRRLSSPIRASSMPRAALPLKLVASAPAVGQYSVAAGVYTFAAADAGAAVLISYTYTVPRAARASRSTRQLIGPSITFSANLFASDPDHRQAILAAALQLRRREARARHQARGFRDARARLPVLRQRRRAGVPAQLRRRGVSEETFESSLAGRRWALPHLPFRAIKAIQPALFEVYADAGGAAMSASVAALGEAQIDAARRGDLARDRSCRSRAHLRRFPRPAVLGRRSDPGLPCGRQGRGPARADGEAATAEASPERENRFRRPDRRGRRQHWLDLGRGARRADRAAACSRCRREWRAHPPAHWLIAAALA